MGMFDDLVTPAPKAKTGMFADMLPKQTEDASFGSRFLHGWRDPIDGGAQLAEKLLNQVSPDAVKKVNQFNNWLADKTGLVDRLPEGGVSQFNQNIENQYQAGRGSNAGQFDGGRLLGNVINPTNIAIAARAPQAASLMGRIGLGAATGAASAALNPVYDNPESFGAEKLKQMALGGTLGGALPILASGIKSIISPAASQNQQLKLLLDQGVKPTIGQTVGGIPARIEDKLQSLPIMGDMITNARKAANDSFATAAINRSLNKIGEYLPDGLKGRDAIAYTQKTLSDAYDNVLRKIGTFEVDPKFTANVNKISDMVNDVNMPAEEKAKFLHALSNLNQSISTVGQQTPYGMTKTTKLFNPDSFKEIESSLGNDAKSLYQSSNIYENKLAPAVKQLQAELRDLLKRQAGSSADELQKVNSGWSNFKLVQNAASKLGAENGEFTPAQFQNAVRALDKSKDKAAFARGDALGQDLGDAGKSILTGKVPDSGTAGRTALNVAALSTGFANPAIPLGLSAGASMYSNPAQNFLRFLATTRPAYAPQVANAVEDLGSLSAPFAAGLLNQYR